MNATPTSLQGLKRAAGEAPRTTLSPPPLRWKTRVFLPGAILLTAALLLLFTSAQTLLPATPVHVVPVVVKTVEGSAGMVTVQAPGWLEPDPHPYYVPALAYGVVEELLVLEGDPVEAGQVVARLVDDDARLALQRADAELAQRRSQRRAAQAELTAARLELEHLVERDRAVATGEATVAEVRAEIVRVRADADIERAQLLELQDEYDRKAALTESQAVSEAMVARLRLRVNAQQSSVEAAQARATVLEAKLAQAEADLRAARTDRTLLIDERRAVTVAEAAVGTAEASVALAEAVRAEAALRLSRMEVRSPVSGVVMRRLASPGSTLASGSVKHSSHVIHVYDPQHMQVRVDVPLADAAHVTMGQSAEITVEVLPDHTFTGFVTRLVHEADIQKNTVEVKVAIDDPSVELKPDMLARVRFIAPQASSRDAIRQRVFAPSALVRDDGTGAAAVLVVTGVLNQRGRVERRTVTAGTRRIDGWIEIEQGLQIGDLVIADPPAGLQAGDRVRVAGEQQPGFGG